MRTTAAVTLSALVLVATVAALPLMGVAQTATTTATSTPTGTTGENVSTEPGEQFAGVVGVQAAEVNGEIETRRFETRLERAENATQRARIVAETTNDTGERLAELRERRERLQAAHENGSLSDGQYRAQLARLAAEIRTAERMANRSAEVTESLPEEAVAASGLNRSAVEELRQNARELRGPEVSEAARDIAGRDDGPPRGPPDERGSNSSSVDEENENESAGAETSGPPADGDAPGRSNETRSGNGSTNDSADSGVSASERGESDENAPEERPNDEDSNDRQATAENRKNGGGESDDARSSEGGENGSNESDGGTGSGDGPADDTSGGADNRNDGDGQ